MQHFVCDVWKSSIQPISKRSQILLQQKLGDRYKDFACNDILSKLVEFKCFEYFWDDLSIETLLFYVRACKFCTQSERRQCQQQQSSSDGRTVLLLCCALRYQVNLSRHGMCARGRKIRATEHIAQHLQSTLLSPLQYPRVDRRMEEIIHIRYERMFETVLLLLVPDLLHNIIIGNRCHGIQWSTVVNASASIS